MDKRWLDCLCLPGVQESYQTGLSNNLLGLSPLPKSRLVELAGEAYESLPQEDEGWDLGYWLARLEGVTCG
jgi:hypothetical protein